MSNQSTFGPRAWATFFYAETKIICLFVLFIHQIEIAIYIYIYIYIILKHLFIYHIQIVINVLTNGVSQFFDLVWLIRIVNFDSIK